jgi:hypothetical protein
VPIDLEGEQRLVDRVGVVRIDDEPLGCDEVDANESAWDEGMRERRRACVGGACVRVREACVWGRGVRVRCGWLQKMPSRKKWRVYHWVQPPELET